MLDILKNFAVFLIPNHEAAEPDATFKWRLAVAVAIICLGGVEIMMIMKAVGFAMLGIAGYASTADISGLQRTQQNLTKSVEAARKEDKQGRDAIAAAVIGKNIFDLRVAQCTAVKAHQVNLAQSYANQITDQKSQYYTLANRGYDEMSCAELGLQ